jgi:hydrogenase/urease accessory protein HupE
MRDLTFHRRAAEQAIARSFVPNGCLKRSALAALVAGLLAVASPAAAHPVPFSYVDLNLQSNTLDVSIVAHVFDLGHDLAVEPADRLLDPVVLASQKSALFALVRGRLRLEADGRPLTPSGYTDLEALRDRQSVRLHVRYAVTARPGIVAVTASMFPYDQTHQTFVNVYEDGKLTSQAILGRSRTRLEYFTGASEGVAAAIGRFVPAGIHHILIGPDHLLFLIGLLLLGGSIRQLLTIVTAFTAAHSVTLTLAALGVVLPPARLVEPAIALSIVYVGTDNLMVGRGRDMRAWIACAFGFIHGFGFASVLREMDLPARALGWSLFSFNVGVEIGQLVVVAAVWSALAALRSHSESAGRRLAFAGSLVVMAAGAFWFIQRVFFPGGIS